MPENFLEIFKSKINDPEIRGRFKRIFFSILPSLKVLILGAFFFFLGFFWTAQDPAGAAAVFSFGFLTGNMTVNFTPVGSWSWEYFRVQFLDYLGNVTGKIFLWNMQVILLCIFTGIAIIPSILMGLLSFSGSLLATLGISMGIKGLVMYLGLFHLQLEILAALLAIDAFLSFYLSLGSSISKWSLQPFKDGFKNEFFPLIFRITLILALAAVLEVFWSTWWVYVFTHPYISWGDFYTQLFYSRIY
jgi:hypothetical protein